MSCPKCTASDTSLSAVACPKLFETLCTRMECSAADAACSCASVSPTAGAAGGERKPQYWGRRGNQKGCAAPWSPVKTCPQYHARHT